MLITPETANTRLLAFATVLQKHFGMVNEAEYEAAAAEMAPTLLRSLYPYDGVDIAARMKQAARPWLLSHDLWLMPIHRLRFKKFLNVTNRLLRHIGKQYVYDPPMMYQAWQWSETELVKIDQHLRPLLIMHWRSSSRDNATVELLLDLVKACQLREMKMRGVLETRDFGPLPKTTFEADLAEFEKQLDVLFDARVRTAGPA